MIQSRRKRRRLLACELGLARKRHAYATLIRIAGAIAVLSNVHVAGAHELDVTGPRNTSELLRSWSFEPGLIFPLLVSAIFYGAGIRRLASTSPRSVRKADIAYFAAGWVAL